MQKRILAIVLFLLPLWTYSQNFIESFEDVPSLFSNGWVQVNNSSPLGSGTWAQDNGNFTAPFGTSNSSIVVGYTSINAGQSGDISNWLITPSISFTEGDSICFYTRSFQNAAYPDRLEVRLNRNNTTDVGSSTTSVGDFDTTLLVINPTLSHTTGGYPMIWKRFGCRISGISPSTPCRIGLRYFVTDGGETGANSSTIGIDHFEYKTVFTGIENDVPLYAYITLANSLVNIEVPDAVNPFSVELIDISGKILSDGTYEKSAAIELYNYRSGVYFVKIMYEGKYLIKKISF